MSARVAVDLRGPPGAKVLVVVPPVAMNRDALAPFLDRLAIEFRVATAELPGEGDAADAEPMASTRDLARLVVDGVNRAVGPGLFHLFGISLGGMVAQWIAVDASGRVDRLVLASTAARSLDAVPHTEPRAALAVLRGLFSANPTRGVAHAILDPEGAGGTGRGFARVDHALDEHPHGTRDLLWLGAAAMTHDARAELASIRAPTLVLGGTEDALIDPLVQDELRAAIPGARSAFVAGAGHDLTLEMPERTAELVLAHLLA